MIAGLTYQGTLATFMSSVRATQDQQQTLAAQASTGLISDDISGLGASAGSVLRLQPQLATVSAYSGSVTQAQTRISVGQTAMSQIATIAATLKTSLTTLQNSTSSDDVQAAVASAKVGLSSLGSLLNTQSGGAYVFSGIATDSPTISDSSALESGTLGDAVSAAIGGNLDDSATAMSAILEAASSDVPFSTALTTSSAASLQTSALIGPADRVATGYVATSTGSASATSTGSPIRDLIAGLTAVASLSSSQLTQVNSSGLLGSLTTMVGGAYSGVEDAVGALGGQQQVLTAQSSLLGSMSDALNTQYNAMTEVDLATVSTEQSTVSTQLQASYSLIADMKSLSLASYL